MYSKNAVQLFEEGQNDFFDDARNRTFWLENFFVTAFFMACIVAMIILGSFANGELAKQEDTLLQAVLKLEQLAVSLWKPPTLVFLFSLILTVHFPEATQC